MGDDCPEHLPHNIDFRKATAEDFADPVPFDLVVGQYVLLHHPDPAAFIGGAAARLQLRGIIGLPRDRHAEGIRDAAASSALRRRVIVEA
jgi:hypothetical protein